MSSSHTKRATPHSSSSLLEERTDEMPDDSSHGSMVPGHPERQSPIAAYRQALCDAQRAVVEACGACDGAGFIVSTATVDGHQCDGTDEMCSQVCPVPMPQEVAEPCEYCQRPVGAIAALERALLQAQDSQQEPAGQPSNDKAVEEAALGATSPARSSACSRHQIPQADCRWCSPEARSSVSEPPPTKRMPTCDCNFDEGHEPTCAIVIANTERLAAVSEPTAEDWAAVGADFQVVGDDLRRAMAAVSESPVSPERQNS